MQRSFLWLRALPVLHCLLSLALRCLPGDRWTALPMFTPSRSRPSPSHTRRPLPRCAGMARVHGMPSWLLCWHAAFGAGMCACTVWCAGTMCLHGWCAYLVCCTVGVCWPAWAFCCLLLSVVTATCCVPGRPPAYLSPARLPARLLAAAYLGLPARLPTSACPPTCCLPPAVCFQDNVTISIDAVLYVKVRKVA